MSPSRPNSLRRNSSSGFKPYNRCATPILGSSTPEVKQEADFPSPTRVSGSPGGASPPLSTLETPPRSELHVCAASHVMTSPFERPGFPSYAQYKQVENGYIQSLTPRRQGKALISQALFDRIWDVLHNPDSPGETAQFRFWARKMFTISKTYRSTLGGIDPDDTPQEVLLHDNLLVAIQEQLYDLLCFCHGSTGHGGRDKTCALIRKHYTWVPKDLVSNFIKACPTCIMKKCGSIDSAALVSQMADEAGLGRIDFSPNRVRVDNKGTPSHSGCSPFTGIGPPGIPWPSLPSPRDASTPSQLADDPLEAAYREAVMRAHQLKNGIVGMGLPSGRVQNLPGMAREVSLYKGLPNGWQYRHDDYSAAHTEFMINRDSLVVQEGDLGIRDQRPRVPSILPFWGPEQFSDQNGQLLQDTDIGDSADIREFSHFDERHYQSQPNLSPGSTSYMFLDHSQLEEEDTKPEVGSLLPQIDPRLLQLSLTSPSAPTHDNPDDSSPQATLGSPRKRAGVPRLHLDLSPGRAPGQSFMSYHEDLGETPDSPCGLSSWALYGKSSPTASERSSSSGGSSQLSRFCRSVPMSAATTVSPASSALPTPVDERSTSSSVLVDGKDGVQKEADGDRIIGLTSGMMKGKLRVVSAESVDITMGEKL